MEAKNKEAEHRKKNPMDKSNIISKLFFCWLCPLFKTGYHRELAEDDLYRHREKHSASKLGDKLERAWNYEVVNEENKSLTRALLKVFSFDMVIYHSLAFAIELNRMIQPIFLSKLLKTFEVGFVTENKNETNLYTTLILVSSVLNVLLSHFNNMGLMQVGITMRVACSSLIYKKALKLRKTALEGTTVGQVVNLLSNDVGRFDVGTLLMYYLWLAPLEALMVFYLLYTNIGYTGVIGHIFLLLSIPVHSYLGKRISQYRTETAKRTDERVRLMNEVINGIQVIKMYTWEKPFLKLVEIARLKEMKFIRLSSIIKSIMMSGVFVITRTAVLMCILVFVLTGNSLTASFVFTITMFYRLLNTVTQFFPQAVSMWAEMLVSIKRIQKFLLYDEMEPSDHKSVNKSNDSIVTVNKNIGIHLTNVYAKWLSLSSEWNLHDFNMDVNSNELVAIVGPIGSGKSTLLHVILREIIPAKGFVAVNGTISYASQEPWIFGGSIKQNILFGQQFNMKKYDEVTQVCALQRDFSLLPYGDNTLSGERGVTLSGGQRARISLARAIYKDADIYLLDDPLSAVDTRVGKQLFDQCICGYLKNKCVLLITHQLQYLRNVKKIYLLENGRLATIGNYKKIKSISNFFTEITEDNDEEEDEINRRSEKYIIKNYDDLENNYIHRLEREEKGVNAISSRVYIHYMNAGGSLLKVLLLVALFCFTQILDSSVDYFVAFWVNVEQWKSHQEFSTSNTSLKILNSTSSLLKADYFKDWWLLPIFDSAHTLVYYSILFLFTIILIYSRSLVFYRWCLSASTRMHQSMLNGIIKCPVSFFNITPCGRILNRFSKDIGALDEMVPMALLDTLQIGLNALAITLVIGSLLPWILVPTIIIVSIFYLLRILFMRTSRDLKRLESATRSPIFSYLSTTLNGLATIRSFGAQIILEKEFNNHQNLNTAAAFVFLGANRTFGFWLDFICVIFISMVLLAILLIKNETLSGNMGLALTQAMGLTGMFQWGMRQWSDLENLMISVERIQEYADLKPEIETQSYDPVETWRHKGKLEFKNVSLRYHYLCVLKNLNFVINPQEKIGIVGRTGAGKSSLIQALFRLVDIEGTIFIDDIDTKTILLNKLRSSISIIPQEPVLFSGTLRMNLDPFQEYTDEVLWDALENVNLKKVVEQNPAGLQSMLFEGGSNFSVGQKQLICLARAIIRKNMILILDEATANVDPHTDMLIQDTIKKKFWTCTVLTIAHRLNTIMNSDKILVMNAGQNVEFDHPFMLLQNHNGYFYSLVKQTGKNTAKNLIAIAEANYLRNKT